MNKRMKAMLMAALMVCLMMMAATGAQADFFSESVYRAMLIGNENYQSIKVQGAINDINRMSNVVQAAIEAGNRYQTPVTRTNLSTAEIKSCVTDMQTWGIDDDDVTMFVYSGQGLLASDGSASLVGEDGTQLKITDLRALLDKLPGTKLIVMDLRYPEAAAQQAKLNEQDAVDKLNTATIDAFRGGTTQQKYQVLCAGSMLKSAEQAAGVLGVTDGTGLGSYYLVQGCGHDYLNQRPGDMLADANKNEAVSLAEARDYINDSVKSLASANGLNLTVAAAIYPDDSQYPLLSRRASAEILSVTLDQPALSIAAGKGAKLNATVTPVNVRQKGVSWFSSDLGVATVDQDGLVRGIRPGTVFVTAMAPNGMTAQSKVLIRDVVFADSVSLSTAKLVIPREREELLKLSLQPSNSNELVTWSSNDDSIASVNDNGLITTHRNGNAVITATTEGGKEVSCVVQVVDANRVVTEISVNKKEISLYEGDAVLVNASIKPANAADNMVTWSSSDESIATVSSNTSVMVAGERAGTAIITATASSGLTAQIQVTVKGTQVKFTKNQVTLKKGKKTYLKYKMQPEGISEEITWTSSDPQIVSVNEDGGVEALQNGEAAITATLPNGQKSVCKVSVASVVVKKVSLKSKLTMGVDEQTQLSAKIEPANASIKTITWTSSNEKVAVVDDAGNVTAVGVGKSVISGKSHNGKGDKCVLTVKPAKVTSIVLDQTELSFMLGVDEPVQINADVEPLSATGNRALMWRSSNEKVVKVSQDGLVTPVGAGKAEIRALSGDVKANCKITVTANRTLIKKQPIGSERKVYVSLRQVHYSKDDLVVQLYVYNRAKKARVVPLDGMLTLTLKDGQVFELKQLTTSSKKIAAGKKDLISYKFPLSDNENLSGLDLREATVEIVPMDGAAEPEGDDVAPDALTTTGDQTV
ncbi:Ig-like domain-containing protein [Eubacteriales bacterium OttesenSCG-928-N13]|nr:Ig-like domain-containing protein [Eubacteriales bacterium OttesenSCG-928-N13]